MDIATSDSFIPSYTFVSKCIHEMLFLQNDNKLNKWIQILIISLNKFRGFNCITLFENYYNMINHIQNRYVCVNTLKVIVKIIYHSSCFVDLIEFKILLSKCFGNSIVNEISSTGFMGTGFMGTGFMSTTYVNKK